MNLRLDDVGGLDPRGSGSAGSGLAALFSSEPEEDFNSLTFQHNRAPPSVLHKKKVEPPAAAEPPPAEDGPPLTLYATLVNAFHSADGAWQPAGQAGLALVGGPLPKPFTIVLYEPTTKRPLSSTSLRTDVPLGVPSPQYVVFSDDGGRSWSVHLPTIDACTHLLQHVTVVRAHLAHATDPRPPPRWVYQDLLVGTEGHAASGGDAIGVKLQTYALTPILQPNPPSFDPNLGEPIQSAGDESKPYKITLDGWSDQNDVMSTFQGGLIGMHKGGIRYVASVGSGLRRVEVLKMKRAAKEGEGSAAPAAEPPPAEPVAEPVAAVAAETNGGAAVAEENETPVAEAEEVVPVVDDPEAEAKAALVSRMARLAGGRGIMGMAAAPIPAGTGRRPSKELAEAAAVSTPAAAATPATPKTEEGTQQAPSQPQQQQPVVAEESAEAPTPTTQVGGATPIQTTASASATAATLAIQQLQSATASDLPPGVHLESLLRIARESKGMQGDLKEAVDSIARRMGTLTAAMEGIETTVLRRSSAGMGGGGGMLLSSPAPPAGGTPQPMASPAGSASAAVAAVEEEVTRLRALLVERESEIGKLKERKEEIELKK